MKLIFILLLFYTVNACAVTPDCLNPKNQLEMNNCSNNELDISTNKLNKKINQISVLIPDNQYFKISNLKWKEYMYFHCKSVTDIYSGGSLYSYALNNCEIDQTKKRIDTLNTNFQDTINLIIKGAP